MLRPFGAKIAYPSEAKIVTVLFAAKTVTPFGAKIVNVSLGAMIRISLISPRREVPASALLRGLLCETGSLFA